MLALIDRKFARVIVAALIVLSSGITAHTAVAQSSFDCWTFQETGKQLCGDILKYWSAQGGLARFGFPLSEQFDAEPGSDQVIQYFERVVFKPRRSSSELDAVVPAPLGEQRFRRKYGNVSSDHPLPSAPYTEMPGDKLDFWEPWFPLSGAFLRYWQERGGVAEFGYPISPLLSEESQLDGKEYLMQYFEGTVFEYHPENAPPYDVLLSQLGTIEYKNAFPAAEDILQGNWCGSQMQITSGRNIRFSFGDWGSFSEPVVLVFGYFDTRGMYERPLGEYGRDWPGRMRDVYYTGRVIGDTITLAVLYDRSSGDRSREYTAKKGDCQ